MKLFLIVLVIMLSGCAVSVHNQSAESSNHTKVQRSSMFIVQGNMATSIHSKVTKFPWGQEIRESHIYFGSNLILPEPGSVPRPIPKVGKRQVMY